MSLARKKFDELKERSGQIDDAELDDFWAGLEPATIDGMIGEWKGGEFVTVAPNDWSPKLKVDLAAKACSASRSSQS